MRCTRGTILGALALAIFAAAPAAASASGNIFITETPAKPPTLQAEGPVTGAIFDQPGYSKGFVDLLDMGDFTAECAEAELDGGEHEGPVSAFSLEASYEGCVIDGTEMSVAMNSCRYAFSNITFQSNHSFLTDVEIACEGGDAIEIAPEGVPGLCTVSIPAQPVEGRLNGYLDVLATKVNGSELEYTIEGEFCGFLGLEEGTFKDGGSESYYELEDMHVVDGTPAIPPRIETSEYPLDLTGAIFDQPGYSKGFVDLLDMGDFTAECAEAELDGGEHEGPVSAFSLEASYEGCVVGTIEMSVAMNSCRYAFSNITFQSKHSYLTDVEIACEDGDAIEIDAAAGPGLCTVSIPAQSVEGRLNDYLEVLATKVNGNGLEYTIEGEFCPFLGLEEGSFEDGSTESYYELHG